MRKKNLIKIYSLLAPILMFTFTFCPRNENISKIQNTEVLKIEDNIKSSTDNINVFGSNYLKPVSTKDISQLEIYPGGTPIGIKISTDGLLIVAFSDVETSKGKIPSPAAQSGLAIGDTILKANNVKVKTSQELIRIINSNNGNIIKVSIDRKGEKFEKELTPVKCDSEDKYKIGLWLRDSTAGVGTLTFYHNDSKKFAALGHPITDVDTNTLINIGKGDIVESSIINVRKGVRGNPGELKGVFIEEDIALGDIKYNTQCGIFGNTNKELINPIANKPMKVALRKEIKEGPAKIITTIDENGPQFYDINIEKLLSQDKPGPKSMIIKVTDSKLLEKTGGIIQGMSGSPIIQNDKIVGAVTHVLINKPDTGYGIYIEWMLEDSNILSK